MAGIVGVLKENENENKSTIEKCYNKGKIHGLNDIGGVVALIEGTGSTVKECYNKGIITATLNDVGEIVGKEENTSELNTLNKLYYLKNERGITAIGGTDDEDVRKITWVTDDLSYEEFKIWIEEM